MKKTPESKVVAKASPATKTATGTPTKVGTKQSSGSSPAAGVLRTKQSSAAPLGKAANGGKQDTATAPTEPTPARRAFDGPELPEPSETEVETQIKELLSATDDKEPSAELTLDIVIRAHVVEEPSIGLRRAASEAMVKQLSHVRLSGMRLAAASPDVLRQLSAATHLYLQHNRLKSAAPLEVLPGLTFVALGHNLIEKVEGLSGLNSLLFLDLSHNRISQLDPAALPTNLRFIKLEGNPCAEGHVRRYTLRKALLQRCPNLRHFDRDLDKDGEEISDEEDDSDEDDEELAGQGPSDAAAADNAALDGDTEPSAHMSGVLDLLDDLERRTYGSSVAARSGDGVRGSMDRSAILRSSISSSRPGTAGQPASIASAAAGGASGTPPRPRSSSASTAAGSVASQAPVAGLSVPGATGSSSSPGSVSGRTSPGRSMSGGAPATVRPGSSASRPGSSAGMPSGGGSRPGSSASRPGSSGGAGIVVGGVAGLRRASLGAAGSAPLPPPASQLGGMGPTKPSAAIVEAAVGEDLAMLQARLSALLEPGSHSTLGQDAAVYDARQPLHRELDRMMGDASARVAAQREADGATAAAIRALRSSSTLATLKAQVNLGPKRTGLPMAAAAGAAQRTASRGSAEAGTAGPAAARPWSASGGSGGVPLHLGPGPVQTPPHSVLRESLSRLEGMLAGGAPGASAGPEPGAVKEPTSAGGAEQPAAARATSAGRYGRTSPTGPGDEKRGAAVGSAAPVVSAKAVATGAAGNKPASAGRPASGVRPASASRPSGAVMAAARAAIAAAKGAGAGGAAAAGVAPSELEAETLAGDEAGTEGLYSEDDEPEEVAGSAAASAPDFGFMFKSSLPPNPFGGGR